MSHNYGIRVAPLDDRWMSSYVINNDSLQEKCAAKTMAMAKRSSTTSTYYIRTTYIHTCSTSYLMYYVLMYERTTSSSQYLKPIRSIPPLIHSFLKTIEMRRVITYIQYIFTYVYTYIDIYYSDRVQHLLRHFYYTTMQKLCNSEAL